MPPSKRKSGRSTGSKKKAARTTPSGTVLNFEKYADEEEGCISMDGLVKLAEELGIDPSTDTKLLVLCWRLGATKPGMLQKSEWVLIGTAAVKDHSWSRRSSKHVKICLLMAPPRSVAAFTFATFSAVKNLLLAGRSKCLKKAGVRSIPRAALASMNLVFCMTLKQLSPQFLGKLRVPTVLQVLLRVQSRRDKKIFGVRVSVWQRCCDRNGLRRDTAISLLPLCIENRSRHTKAFVKFLESKPEDFKLNKDQWCSFLDFSVVLGPAPEFEGWDAEESSWPLLLDEFVEWAKARPELCAPEKSDKKERKKKK